MQLTCQVSLPLQREEQGKCHFATQLIQSVRRIPNVSESDTNEAATIVPEYGNSQFSHDVIERFPELREGLEFDANLLHPQMGELAAAVRASIESGESDLPLKICAFLDEVLSRSDAISEIENAVAISFVQT